MAAWLAGNANAMWALTFLFVLILSLLPGGTPESEVGSSWIWNFGHVPAYAALAAVTGLVLAKRGLVGANTRILIFAAAVSLAAGIELLQPLVRRTASIADVGYGALGAVFGIWVQALLTKRVDAAAAKREARHGC